MSRKKKTKGAQSKKAKKSSAVQAHITMLKYEAWGFCLIVLSVCLLLNLIGYAFMTSYVEWLGQIGLWVYRGMIWSLGAGSLVLIGGIFWVGFALFVRKSFESLRVQLVAFFFLLFSTSVLFDVFSAIFSPVSLLFSRLAYTAPLDGLTSSSRSFLFLGGIPFHFLYRKVFGVDFLHLLGRGGTIGLFSLLFLVSFSLFVPFSLLALCRKMRALYAAFLTWGGRKRETWRRWITLCQPASSQANKKEERVVIRPEKSPQQRPTLSRQMKRAPLPERKAGGSGLNMAAPAQSHITPSSDYHYPPLSLLAEAKKRDDAGLKKNIQRQAEVLEETLSSFSIDAKVSNVHCGPRITSFEVIPSVGTKVQKIKALANDIALNMEAPSIRIIAPIPGKAAVGIEVPNPSPQEVNFRQLLELHRQSKQTEEIPLLLGKNVRGSGITSDLTKMPHCIIAGATGAGKSVCINTIVMSIIMNRSPEEVRLLMVDPKKVELSAYTKLPHMIAPVIIEPSEACSAMHWLVKEMERRYELLQKQEVRNIKSFNAKHANAPQEKMHYIVGIIDELADLMMVAGSDIEMPIARIAQMARAVGIHLIIATQRPSREVITGLIKANFPTRIAFKVASRVNSQIILDEIGAETLLGNGDMLFLAPGTTVLERSQGVFISDEDIQSVIDYIHQHHPPHYLMTHFDGEEGGDALYQKALTVAQGMMHLSSAFLAKKLQIKEDRAQQLLHELYKNGFVVPIDGGNGWRVVQGNRSLQSNEN